MPRKFWRAGPRRQTQRLRELRELDPKQRHKLRIALKKLRYGGDFFESLFVDRKTQKRLSGFKAHLKTLQDHLGSLNDISAHQKLASQLATRRSHANIAFGSVLRQKGAAHSRKMDPPSHRKASWKFGPRRTVREWLYANSLSLAFFGMFIAIFVLHGLFGEWKYNEDQALRHLPPTSLASYACSSSFWFSVFQCWEAEFAVIGIYIVLSIFLRQETRQNRSRWARAINRLEGPTNKSRKPEGVEARWIACIRIVVSGATPVTFC